MSLIGKESFLDQKFSPKVLPTFGRLVDANVVGVFTWNLDGRIVEANGAFLNLVQYNREELASGSVRWTDITPAGCRERVQRALAEVIKTGTVQPFESELFYKDGSRVPVLVVAALFEEGGHDGVAFLLDLSEQKRTEEILRQSESELRDTIDTIPAMVWTCLPDGSDVYVNKRWTEYVGLTATEASGSGWQATLHPEDLQEHLDKRHISFILGEPLDVESRYRRAADGNTVWILIRGVPFRDQYGHILRWYGTLTDIEDRKRAEGEIRALRDQLYRENVALRDEIDRTSMFEEIVGTSKPLKAILSQIATFGSSRMSRKFS